MMAWRIFRWRRRDPVASAGRHTRPLIGASVPGAAGTLVSSAARWDTGIDPHVPGVVDEPVPLPAPEAGAAPAAHAAHEPENTPHTTPPPPARSSAARAPEPSPVAVGVSLGFSDGAQVVLEADDPRVRTFRAAAAALLEAPRA